MNEIASKILIVDDDLLSLKIIEKALTNSKHVCMTVNNSNEAISAAKAFKPDLFILDYLMPGINGVMLCRELKKNILFKNTPMIFITMLRDTEQKLEAFNAGAVDFISKPINAKEVGIRVKTHLELARTRKELEEYAADMENLARERVEQLIHADRLITLGVISAGIVHDVKNPATFISGNVQTIEMFWNTLKPAINMSGANSEKLRFIKKEMPSTLTEIMDGVDRIKGIVERLKAFYKKGYYEKVPCLLSGCLENALTLCRKVLKDNIVIKQELKDENVMVIADHRQIEQVLVNIFLNTADALKKNREPIMHIRLYKDLEYGCINISDNGLGISDENLKKIWEPFFTTKGKEDGTGLGLFIAKSIIEEHTGTIMAGNQKQGGAFFNICLPLENQHAKKT